MLAKVVAVIVTLTLTPSSRAQITYIPGVVLNGSDDACPTMEELVTAKQRVSSAINDILVDITMPDSNMPECGDGTWRQVANLSLSDTSQQCPSGWMLFTSPARSCGRPQSAPHGCNQASFSVDTQYSKVCGRATARIIGSPDGFETFGPRTNENYVDGISVTHSITRDHIWTFAASPAGVLRCPCSTVLTTAAPSFVGNNYFCDTTTTTSPMKVTLWDGMNCGTLECCNFNSPPWFTVQLPAATTDNIDAHLCGDESAASENFFVEVLELYVQ